MLVKDYMTPHPISIQPEAPISEAQQLIRDNGIRHLPVVNKGKELVGILTPSRMSITVDKMTSLDVWEISNRLTKVTVGDLMVAGDEVFYTYPDATLEEAARILVTQGITGLPVVDDTLLVGVITQTDLMAQLFYLLGGSEPGIRVAIRMPDRGGELGKIYEVVYGHGWGMRAVGGMKSPVVDGMWDAVLKIHRYESEEEVVAALNAIEDQEVLDARYMDVPSPEGEATA